MNEDDFKIEKEDYDSDEEFSDANKKDPIESDSETTYFNLLGTFKTAELFLLKAFVFNLSYNKRYLEHMNPKSYSWCLLRYAIIKYSLTNIKNFLNVIGIEPQGI
jgi:hypothetical protein